MSKSPTNGFIPDGNQLARTVVAPEKLALLKKSLSKNITRNPYQNKTRYTNNNTSHSNVESREVRVPQVKKNGKVIQKASIVKNLPSLKTSISISKPVPPMQKNPYSSYSNNQKKIKAEPIKFELPPINMKKEKPLEDGFDHIISIGDTYNNALHIEESGLSNQTYAFDMISNLTLDKAHALIHPKLHANTLLLGYNVNTQKTRLHNLEIPHLANEKDKNILKKLKQYYELKLNELQTILLSGKRVLFVHRATKTEFKHKHYVYEFINQISERYPGLDFHLLTCNYTNTTNTKHTNVFVSTTEKFIEYLKENVRVSI